MLIDKHKYFIFFLFCVLNNQFIKIVLYVFTVQINESLQKGRFVDDIFKITSNY